MKRWTDRYVQALYHSKWLIGVLSAVLFAFCVGKASHLKLQSDFKSMLPENFQSVKDLDRIVGRIGGTGSLIIAVECDDPQASIHFANDLVARLKAYPKTEIGRIEYNAQEVKTFFEDNKYLYMDLPDLEEMYSRLDRRIKREKLGGLYIDFQTPAERDEEFTTKDIENKYRDKHANYEGYIDGYFFGEKGKLMAIVVKPAGSATGVEFSKHLVAKVKRDVDALAPTHYHPSMRVGFTGNVMRVQYEYNTLINDIISTAFLCVSLVGLAVFLYFRRVRMVVLMAWAVLNGVAWTFAIAQATIGYLTTQTAFLGSIIVGNGINYGLILMARYLEERKRGHPSLTAMQIAIPATLPGTLASSCTTAVGFGALFITQVRGFTHFAFIGSLGMFLCWVATYTILPVFLGIFERIRASVREDKFAKADRFSFSPMTPFANRLPVWAPRIRTGGIVATALALVWFVYFLPNALEYDFTKLKVKSKGKEISQEATLNARVRAILGGSATPSVMVADRIDQVVPLCDEIMRKNNALPPDKRVIANCKSLYTYVPKDQDEKIAWLKKMRALLEDSTLNFLNAEQKQEVERFKAQFTGRHIVVDDLPKAIVDQFREKNGDVGKVAFVYPTDTTSLWNGKELIRFANLIRENHLPNGEVITASGESVIFADLLQAVAHDGPRATLLSFIAVCAVVIMTFRERRAVFFVIGTLVFGVAWMAGLIALFHIKINFFNFIAIPTTFGIGIDYGVNMYQRYKLEGRGSLPQVLKSTGSAVALCSLTTIIGYFTLVIARNQALVSFGWIGIWGEVTCLVAALVFIPALVIRRETKQGTTLPTIRPA